VLALLAGGASLGVLAACGESAPQASAELRQDLQEALERARTVATTSVERAPSAGGMPQPGDRRRVTVLFPSSGWGGGPENRDLEPIMISARFGAAAETENRYDFEAKSLPSKIDSRWEFADVLEAFSAAGGPALVMLDVADLRGLSDAKRLLPLNEHLASDAAFDPAAYWPHLLETGQIDGAQYALPVAVAPWITILNADLASSSGIEPPAREDFDRDSLLQLALAMQGGPAVQGREHALGYHRFVDPPTTALPDVNAWPPLYAYVMSAVGQLRAEDGSFDALRSTQALDAVRFIQDLRKVHGVEAEPGRSGRRVWATLNEGNLGMFGWSLRGGNVTWLRGPGRPENLLYPFPRMGTGGAPVGVWAMLAIPADVPNPAVAYQALGAYIRALYQVASVPALRMSVADLQTLDPFFRDGEAQMVVDLLDNATYITLTRREQGVLRNTLDGGVVLNDLSPREALDEALLQLDALKAGA
jgi:ABC-type glycerol-3-phosphate transport system substrate-binding protein